MAWLVWTKDDVGVTLDWRGLRTLPDTNGTSSETVDLVIQGGSVESREESIEVRRGQHRGPQGGSVEVRGMVGGGPHAATRKNYSQIERSGPKEQKKTLFYLLGPKSLILINFYWIVYIK